MGMSELAAYVAELQMQVFNVGVDLHPSLQPVRMNYWTSAAFPTREKMRATTHIPKNILRSSLLCKSCLAM